jgi:hypothetical protein
MKQIVRYQNLIITNKLRSEIRLTVDDKSIEFVTNYNGDKNTAIGLFPIVSLVIVRPTEVDDTGNKVRPTWNPSDSLGMTKYTLPIFVSELKAIQNDLKISNLYTYAGKKLELNNTVAEKIRRVFIIGRVTVELSAVVITQQDTVGEDVRLEGIKMKFNNEQSTVQLTLNDLESLIFNLGNLDVDSISFMLYLNYINKPKQYTNNVPNVQVDVDIQPKPSDVDIDDLPI